MSPRAPAAALLVAGVVLGSPARAELTWPKLTLASYVGVSHFDRTYQLTGAIPLGVRAGFTFSGRFGLEGSYGKVFGDSRLVPGHNFPLNQYGVDLVANLRPATRLNPFLFGGWAQLDLDGAGNSVLRLPGLEFGGGVKIRIANNPGARWDLRLDARNLVIKNESPLDQPEDYQNHFMLTAGISMTLANPDRDSDEDGVLDRFDRCPGTVIGARVDPFGCVLDYDGDGVPDGLDPCPSTPRGATVDARGCPSDADGDGIMDGLDICADTPPGVRVDPRGCALDTDRDGVFDGIDQCPGTPARVLVDATGCPLTPAVGAVETEFLDTGTVVLDNVTFEVGKANLLPASFGVLDEVGQLLVRHAELKVEIGGYTDSMGDDDANLELSRNRARAVLDYLLRHFRLEPGRFTAVGYGESRPLAPEDSPAARARNRRVEFKILNPPPTR